MDEDAQVDISGARLRIAVVGDVHLGPRPGQDAFGHEPGAFLGWLHQLLDTHDHLVLNGDIFQCDHELGARPGAHRRALEACLGRLPGLGELLTVDRVHLVHGNHDEVAREALGAPTTLTFGEPGARLLVTHGDAYDPVLGGAPGVSHAATWLCGRIRAGGLARVAGFLEERDIGIKGRRFKGAEGPYAVGAAGLMREQGAEVVVLGHTHVADRHELQAGTYLNPGAACGGRRGWASVDLGAGTAVLEQRQEGT